MKLIHLSDLHLGKRVNGFSMMEDQRYILKQIVELAEQEQPDGILIAGDVYDKGIPTVEAVQLLNDFLCRLANGGIPVFLISGNHDSAERLAFGAELLESRRVHISPVYDGTLKKVTLTDEHGPVHVYLMPFLKPAYVRHVHPEAEVDSYERAVRVVLDRTSVNLKERNVLVAHQFVTGAKSCESEEISVGGLEQIDASVFKAFDYVALGHIHSPQSVGREMVRYCGTPLKYSFSESSQTKTVTVVTLGQKGEIQIEERPLIPLRDMRSMKGTYAEVTQRSFYENSNTQDYLQIILTDEEDVLDGLQKLRVIYPNLMQLVYDNRRTRENRSLLSEKTVQRKSELELFEEFYQLQNNHPMDEWQEAFVREILEEEKETEEKGGGKK